ncbi:deaminase [Phyllobacterium phragmitis]|uniref:deaminase n=1 Tax=Phyllobacterium phragmitis TaxID=2670329 RepID=UPI0038B3ECDC
MKLAFEVSRSSPIISRKVGAVIVAQDDSVIASSANSLPFPSLPTEVGELNGDTAKAYWIEHAERAAIFEAARKGVPLAGTRMYTTFFPCTSCMRAIIQSGIAELICPPPEFNHEKWGQEFYHAELMLRWSSVILRVEGVDQRYHSST